MKRDYGVYQVALKVLLRRGDEVLFLRSDDGKYWDLPGGRIDNGEAKTPLQKILAREVREELGPAVRYKLGRPLFQFRRYYSPGRIYILQTVYDGIYLSGDIKLSHEHSSYTWINPGKITLKKKDFDNNEEYLAFKDYFKHWFNRNE